MQLCDKCYECGDYVKATDQIVIKSTHERFDLCESCMGGVREFINDRAGRTIKDVSKVET